MLVDLTVTYRGPNNTGGPISQEKEKSGSYWKSKLPKLNADVFCIRGGEPFLYPDISKIAHLGIIDTTGIALPQLKDIVHNGGTRGFAVNITSIHDNFGDNKLDKLSTMCGLRALHHLHHSKILKFITLTITDKNIFEVPSMVWMLNKNFGAITSVNLTHNEHGPVKYDELHNIVGKLVELSEKGATVDPPEFYGRWLEEEPWKCDACNIIGINPDGHLKCCKLYDGEEICKYTINDLINNRKEVEKAYKKDLEKCPGCLYNSYWIHNEIQEGRLDKSYWR